jgi:hypothetical protein
MTPIETMASSEAWPAAPAAATIHIWSKQRFFHLNEYGLLSHTQRFGRA